MNKRIFLKFASESTFHCQLIIVFAFLFASEASVYLITWNQGIHSSTFIFLDVFFNAFQREITLLPFLRLSFWRPITNMFPSVPFP